VNLIRDARGDTSALGDRADGRGLVTAFKRHRAGSVGDLLSSEIGLRDLLLAGESGCALQHIQAGRSPTPQSQ
jgi:hypothetical protein